MDPNVFDSISPTTTQGDFIVRDNAGDNVRLPVGSTGQIISTDSTVARGVVWTTAKSLLPGTTKGDIIVTDGAGHNNRLAVGVTNGMVLSVDSTTATGLRWGTVGGGGSGTPGGSTSQVQYNNGGAFGGAAQITVDSAGLKMTIGPGTRTNVSFDVAGSIANVPFTLTDASSIALDASRSNVFIVRLTGQPRTLANPTNVNIGQKILLIVSQDATGSRKMGFGTAYKLGTDVPSYDASTTAGTRDYIGLHCLSTVSCDVVSVSRGYR
jgi:hypothetical protein